MNVTQATPEQATAALMGWLSRSDFRVDLADEDGPDCVWHIAKEADEEGTLSMRRFEHLNALALSYTQPLAHGPRLKKLELVSELNESAAFARFSLTRSGDLQVEYMISCANDYLPSCLAPILYQLFDMQQPLRQEIKSWGLDPDTSRPELATRCDRLC